MSDSDLDRFEAALLAMDRAGARRIFQARAEIVGALAAMESTMTVALESLGRRWERGECALSQIYMAGKICEELSLAFLPETAAERRSAPRIALAVFEDRHLLGKRMVHAVLAGAGYRVADWGFATRESVLERIDESEVEVLMLSTLMLSSGLRVEGLCAELARRRRRPRVVVGGAPFRLDPGLWREVGADAMGAEASDAPRLLAAMLSAGGGLGDGLAGGAA